MASILFPRSALDQGAITAMRRRAAEVVQWLAAGGSKSGYGYRSFRASDTSTNGNTVVGHNTNGTALTANTYLVDAFANCTPKAEQAFGIFGIGLALASPFLDEIRISVDNVPIALLPLHEIKSPAAGTTPQIGYILDPVWCPPLAHLKVDLLSGTAQTISTEFFDLIGYVGEKAGTNTVDQAQPETA